jgi:hypothetical protein
MNPMLPVSRPAVLAAAAIVLAGTARAAVVINSFTNVAPGGGAVHSVHDPSASGTPDLITASAADLVNGMTATVTYTGGPGSTTLEQSAGQAVWTDGSISTVYAEGGPGGDSVDHAAYGTVQATVGGGDIDVFVTFDLGSLHDLTRVDVFTGWNDSGRDDSSFNLLVSPDNVTFTAIAAYLKPADNTGAFGTPVTNLHRITDDGAGNIASAVRYVQLQFTDADNGYAGLLEVDVIGSPVPEPSVVLLGGWGLLGLLRRRR